MASGFKAPSVMREGLTYEDWKKERNIWRKFTDLSKQRQGGALFLTLTGKARETVLAEVPLSKFDEDSGIDEITKALDTLYLQDATENAFVTFDSFIKFRRPQGMSLKEYLAEFNLRYNKIKDNNMTLPDGVLAYALLTCANLPEDQEKLCRATVSSLTYKEMKAQIEKVCTTSTHMGEKSKPEFVRVESQYFTKLGNEQNDQSGAADKSLCGECHTRMTPGLRQSDGRTDCGQYEVYDNECEESYFVQKSLRPYHSHNNPRQRNTNPLDDFGNPQSCRYCKSIDHFLNDCPDAPPHTSTAWRGRNVRGGSFRGRSRGGRGGPAKQEDRKF